MLNLTDREELQHRVSEVPTKKGVAAKVVR